MLLMLMAIACDGYLAEICGIVPVGKHAAVETVTGLQPFTG
jgi:hypothetical protein